MSASTIYAYAALLFGSVASYMLPSWESFAKMALLSFMLFMMAVVLAVKENRPR